MNTLPTEWDTVPEALTQVAGTTPYKSKATQAAELVREYKAKILLVETKETKGMVDRRVFMGFQEIMYIEQTRATWTRILHDKKALSNLINKDGIGVQAENVTNNIVQEIDASKLVADADMTYRSLTTATKETRANGISPGAMQKVGAALNSVGHTSFVDYGKGAVNMTVHSFKQLGNASPFGFLNGIAKASGAMAKAVTKSNTESMNDGPARTTLNNLPPVMPNYFNVIIWSNKLYQVHRDTFHSYLITPDMYMMLDYKEYCNDSNPLDHKYQKIDDPRKSVIMNTHPLLAQISVAILNEPQELFGKVARVCDGNAAQSIATACFPESVAYVIETQLSVHSIRDFLRNLRRANADEVVVLVWTVDSIKSYDSLHPDISSLVGADDRTINFLIDEQATYKCDIDLTSYTHLGRYMMFCYHMHNQMTCIGALQLEWLLNPATFTCTALQFDAMFRRVLVAADNINTRAYNMVFYNDHYYYVPRFQAEHAFSLGYDVNKECLGKVISLSDLFLKSKM
jgi:hypothetical protein